MFLACGDALFDMFARGNGGRAVIATDTKERLRMSFYFS